MKIEIKDKISERLQDRVHENGDFKNIEDYINYILGQVVERLDQEKEEFSEKDEEKIKERLSSLGYLD